MTGTRPFFPKTLMPLQPRTAGAASNFIDPVSVSDETRAGILRASLEPPAVTNRLAHISNIEDSIAAKKAEAVRDAAEAARRAEEATAATAAAESARNRAALEKTFSARRMHGHRDDRIAAIALLLGITDEAPSDASTLRAPSRQKKLGLGES